MQLLTPQSGPGAASNSGPTVPPFKSQLTSQTFSGMRILAELADLGFLG